MSFFNGADTAELTKLAATNKTVSTPYPIIKQLGMNETFMGELQVVLTEEKDRLDLQVDLVTLVTKFNPELAERFSLQAIYDGIQRFVNATSKKVGVAHQLTEINRLRSGRVKQAPLLSHQPSPQE